MSTGAKSRKMTRKVAAPMKASDRTEARRGHSMGHRGDYRDLEVEGACHEHSG